MKFLLDANLPCSIKELFDKRHKVFHLLDIGLSSAEDEEVINWAKKNKAALVTRDLDFANILRFSPQKYFGILVLRVPSFYNTSAIKRVLGEFLLKANFKSFSKSTIIIEEGRFRIRK